MLTNISKWGNSLGIRIPRSIAEQVNMIEGEPVEILVENNHILIQKTYRLDALLAKVTADNIHSEIDTGSAIGGEAW